MVNNDNTFTCAVLIATKDRFDLLVKNALDSVLKQTIKPDRIVIVNDGKKWSKKQIEIFDKVVENINACVIPNSRANGAAGAWNTGIQHLKMQGFSGYVAILDDDDIWDSHHLFTNLEAVQKSNADISISGLRINKNGFEIYRDFINDLCYRKFLVGNPGWQGSNTFVRIDALLEVGGYRDGLISCNDRDLAIRLLKCNKYKTVVVHDWTATWNIDQHRPTLSTPSSHSKTEGLKTFWTLYSHIMTLDEQKQFLSRALEKFKVNHELILNQKSKIQVDEKGSLFYD